MAAIETERRPVAAPAPGVRSGTEPRPRVCKLIGWEISRSAPSSAEAAPSKKTEGDSATTGGRRRSSRSPRATSAEPAISGRGNVADGFVHTVHRDGRWRNFIEGEQDWLRGAFRSKETAVVAGAVEARHRRTRHVIHDEDDRVIELNSYSDNRGARAA